MITNDRDGRREIVKRLEELINDFEMVTDDISLAYTESTDVVTLYIDDEEHASCSVSMDSSLATVSDIWRMIRENL